MARFMARMTSKNGKKIHRLAGQCGTDVVLNGWHCGVRVTCSVENGKDKFIIERTGGSSGSGADSLIDIVREK